MLHDKDHYEAYYSDKLWNLIPAIYRTEDTDNYDKPGPLRELVNRIGVQAAILRRSIDRTWEDQSIESCDDWIIPYIADLLMTQLVPSLDARGQRLDVAKTIYYRRRKGTVGLIEELSSDITGWEARVVEFFSRLGRTRHFLDPEIGAWIPTIIDDAKYATLETKSRSDKTPGQGDLSKLQRAEGLIGTLTKTGIGGWADLRSVAGASKTNTAYDEYYHTGDMRKGRGRTGWYNIPRLGVFLWRLRSFDVDWSNPVPIKGCPGHYTFDPTGRTIALFAAASRQENRAYGDSWASPEEWQLPTPISTALLQDGLNRPDDAPLWATTDSVSGESDLNSLGVFRKPGPDYIAVLTKHAYTDKDDAVADPDAVIVYPELGRFQVMNPPVDDIVFSTYHYGFSSTLGAGPYDRRRLGDPSIPAGTVFGGGNAFDTALSGVAAKDEVVIGDSLTYTKVRDLAGIDDLTLGSANRSRPVIRLKSTAKWTFKGNKEANLTLSGLLISGCDIVLEGEFNRVTIQCCTLDPGNWDTAKNKEALAVDGQKLVPCHLVIRARVRELVIDRSVCGPITLDTTGKIETLSANDTIIQAIGDEKAISVSTGVVQLEKVTVLGKADIHRLYASDSILGDVFKVEDTQHGCVRFSAWSTGSKLPSPYECVRVAANAPLYNSREYGEAAYCQLREGVDVAIKAGAKNRTISSGSENGSEMGAFCQEKNSIKERSLLLKFEEFVPLGLTPVLIYAT